MSVAKFMFRRQAIADRFLANLPLVTKLAAWFKRVASIRVGGIPVGLGALLPVAIAIDLADFIDEAVPIIGPIASFLVETAFVLGLTGRTSWSLGVAAFDLIPGLDIVPVASLTVLSMMKEAYNEGRDAPTRHAPTGPVVDV